MRYFDHRVLTAILAVLVLSADRAWAAWPAAQDAKPAVEQDAKSKHAERDKPPKDINDSYRDPDIKTCLGRLETESREIYAKRERIAKDLGIKPGMSVADIGAGTGFFTFLFAKHAGPRGRVYAVDIAKEMTDRIDKLAAEQKLENIKTVVCAEDSVDLPYNSVDLAFICDTYHHFEHAKETMTSLFRAMRPGSELVVIDFFRIEGKTREWVFNHVRAGKKTFTKEIEAVGFELIDDGSKIDYLEENYVIRFRKKDR